MDLKTYTQMKEKVDDLQRRTDRAQGALEGLLSTLKKEFGCSGLDSAECLLFNKEQELEEVKQEIEEETEAFWNKYGGLLERL